MNKKADKEAVCSLDPSVPLNQRCDMKECDRCGWNPSVNATRRRKIHELAAAKKLREWGG